MKNGFGIRVLLIFIIAVTGFRANAEFADSFLNPSDSARPWTFWFWINGNISRDGITADLEAMARVGIRGVLIMEVANPKTMAPEGQVKFGSPEWKTLFSFVLKEAERLGLQVIMNNDAGWAGSGGPWVTPEQSMKQLVSTSTAVTGPSHISLTLEKPVVIENFYRDIDLFALPAEADSKMIATENVPVPGLIRISDRMTSDGKLNWDAPPGDWTLLRIGYTSTGKKNKPPPKSGEGLEVDKFDAGALKKHFDAFIGTLAEGNKSLSGKSFWGTHIDSWEVGPQTWTEDMAREFKNRRGYDIIPWLPILTGLDSGTTLTERFQRDFTLTCAELNDENYAGALRKVANAEGLKLSIEAYGQAGFLNPLTYGAQADIPVSEFWISRWDAWHLLSPRLMASVAHVFGRNITAAESFTSMPDMDPFTEHPYSVKPIGDWAMTEGVNRIVFHRTVHDPWLKYVPGMSFGGFGWHVDRKQTWFEQSSGFMTYLARCQTILQKGTFVADVCRLVPDGELRGNTAGMRQIPAQSDALPMGYNYDYISDTALLSEMGVKDGLLSTRAGMQYRVLQLPKYTTMTLELARKVADLVKEGGTVAGPAPLHTPGLSSFPESENKLRDVVNSVWTSNSPLHVISNKTAGQALLDKNIGPDCSYTIDPVVNDDAIHTVAPNTMKRLKGRVALEMPTQGLNWIHRRLDEGEFYFVANPQYRDVNALCTFRVADRMPELWYPETGKIVKPAVFCTSDTIKLPIHFSPAESVFVVFRDPLDTSKQVVQIDCDGKLIFRNDSAPSELPGMQYINDKLEVDGQAPGHYELTFGDGRKANFDIAHGANAILIDKPWDVDFQADRGAPEHVKFTKLVDWTNHEDMGIRYFSGTATYHTTFNIDALTTSSGRWNLDLGKVLVMAEVRLNGKELGVLWKPPFSVDVSDAVRTGQNELEIKITNLWPNRMIGDEQYPDDSSENASWVKGRLPNWPAWITNDTSRPEPRRITFTTFKYYQKDSPLLPSGLLGPVKIEFLSRQTVNSDSPR